MKFILITNNRKVYNFFRETNDVYFFEDKKMLEILKFTSEKVHEGHKLLTDPIISNMVNMSNPFKSVAISEEKFSENKNFENLIDGALTIASKLEIGYEQLNEEQLEEYRFVDLNLLIDATKIFGE